MDNVGRETAEVRNCQITECDRTREEKTGLRKERMEREIAIRGPGDRWKIRAATAQARTNVTETWVDKGGIRPEVLQFRLVQP